MLYYWENKNKAIRDVSSIEIVFETYEINRRLEYIQKLNIQNLDERLPIIDPDHSAAIDSLKIRLNSDNRTTPRINKWIEINKKKYIKNEIEKQPGYDDLFKEMKQYKYNDKINDNAETRNKSITALVDAMYIMNEHLFDAFTKQYKKCKNLDKENKIINGKSANEREQIFKSFYEENENECAKLYKLATLIQKIKNPFKPFGKLWNCYNNITKKYSG